VAGSREAWSPISSNRSEHNFKYYFLLDLSSGKFNSSMAFNGWYTSGGLSNYVTAERIRYPNEMFPFFWSNPGGTTRPNINIPGGFTQYVTSRVGIYSADDQWELNVRYNVSAPLVSKVTWFVTIDITNPFNDRHRSPSAPPRGSYINQRETWEGVTTPILDNYMGVWRPTTMTGGDTLYTGRVDGRRFSLQSGFRF
jgi:hypothetical protein